MVVAKRTDKSGDKENLRIRLSPDLAEGFAQACDSRNCTKQTAIARLVEWWVDQEPEVQLMVIKSMPMSPELTGLILKRLSGPKSKKPRGVVTLPSQPLAPVE